jgi:hypothetical protein
VDKDKFVVERDDVGKYKAPKLIIFGGMTALTASGSGAHTENSGNDDDNTAKRKP